MEKNKCEAQETIISWAQQKIKGKQSYKLLQTSKNEPS